MIYVVAGLCAAPVAFILFLSWKLRREQAQVDEILAPEAEASRHITKITNAPFIEAGE